MIDPVAEIEFTPEERRSILGFVRMALSSACRGGAEPEIPAVPRLADMGACFVTLRESGNVRGCIGSVEAFEPLADNLRRNAENAAFADPAFPPLEADELNFVTLEVSVISSLRRLDAPEAFAPGRDGLLFVCGGRRAVFLPQVALEMGWSAEETLDNLARKAGVDPGAWRSNDAEVHVFRCETFSE